MDWHTFLIAIHLIGTVLGVGAATFAEIFLLKSLRDGEVDPIESSFMQVSYKIIRVGLALLILSGFGFLIFYRLTGLEERLFSTSLWSKLTIVFIIVINAVLLQARKVPLWLGSALSFASWWAAMLVVPLKGYQHSYFTILAWYFGFVLLVAVVLFIIRKSLGIKI